MKALLQFLAEPIWQSKGAAPTPPGPPAPPKDKTPQDPRETLSMEKVTNYPGNQRRGERRRAYGFFLRISHFI